MHTENVFNCTECPKKFSTNTNLRKHVKSTHEKEYIECSLCKDKICSTKLKRHKIACEKKNTTVFVDVEKKKEKTYPCEKCEKVFSFKHARLNHIKYFHKKIQCH